MIKTFIKKQRALKGASTWKIPLIQDEILLG